jgi:hypothetical protein
MAERTYRFGCFEAKPAETGPGVAALVTDRDGQYVGVQVRKLSDDERAGDLDLCARFQTRKHVKRVTNEIRRAVKRKMLTQHGEHVVATDVVAAMKLLGVGDEPPAPKPKPKPKTPKASAKKTTKKATKPADPADK